MSGGREATERAWHVNLRQAYDRRINREVVVTATSEDEAIGRALREVGLVNVYEVIDYWPESTQ